MKKVLVAEDEESIREFIVINLTRGGYTVEQAASQNVIRLGYYYAQCKNSGDG